MPADCLGQAEKSWFPAGLKRWLRSTWLCLALATVWPSAWASGPRYVTGPPFFTGPPGVPVGWKQATLLYSTDPGSLSLSVDHAASDALVAAAAGIWNVPVAGISITQGPALAEHVSGQNVFLSTGGLVWPSDVQSSNYAAVPVAVVYDTDGSVTETLLGSGASDPGECRQNAVTESVDRFDPAGYILHAIIVVNGRCTGPAPEQQMQLQYQLERVFGRVLGLAWSQTNDNVYTGMPQPTYAQALHWPIMHPLDILCGPYSYQCLPDPFTLRPDDVAGLVGVYPVAAGGSLPAGKQVSLSQANAVEGSVTFPTGEGMAGVNVLVQRTPRFSPMAQGWFETSAVTGSSFRRNAVSPFVSTETDAEASFGTTDLSHQGLFFIPYLEVVDPFGAQGEIVTTEPINPLYIEAASVGPYAPGAVSPAGSPPVPYSTISGPSGTVSVRFPIADAPATCRDGLDGSPELPMVLPPEGWWKGLLCGYGHASYIAAPVRGGRSLTVEVTALDANGLATTSKAMPVIGLFASDDQPGSLPSLGVAASAFNSLVAGTTTLKTQPFAQGDAVGTIRIGIADQRGDGRPDFPYQARLFYADSVEPAAIEPTGGTITISGTGFRAGNVVTINGVNATVSSWTATTIVASAPSISAVGGVSGTPVDLVVSDLGTGATSTMTGALTYQPAGSAAGILKLVSAPSSAVFVGDAAGIPFAVQALKSDGITPAPGETVVFTTAPAGTAQFTACGAAACSVTTDAKGMASTGVTPERAGTIALQAADGALQVNAVFTALAKPAAMRIITVPAANELVGVASKTGFMVQVVTANGTGIAGELVTFSVAAGSGLFSGCNASPCSILSNVYGQAVLTVTPTAAGAVTLRAVDGALSQTTSFTSAANTPSMKLLTAPNPTAYVNESGGVLRVQLLEGDGVTGIAKVPVIFHAPPNTRWSVCGLSVCPIDTDNNGQAASALVTSVAGTIQLQATYGSLSVSATSVVGVRSPKLTLVSAPSGSIDVGATTATPFVVQLVDGYDRPMAGQQVNYGGVQGMVKMDCGLGSCIGFTDANGRVGSAATPLQPGTIRLDGTWLNQNVTASFTALGTPEALNQIVVPAATVPIGDKQTFQYQLIGPTGTPLKGHGVYLSVAAGALAFDGCPYGTCGATTDANGMVTATATPWVAGPVTVRATADGWESLASFTVVAQQPPTSASLSIVSGGQQAVSAGAALQPLVVRVTDPAGQAVAGITVHVGQTVRALDAPCPPRGRCPAAPTLASSSAVLTSDLHGLVSIMPLVVPGTATKTSLEFSAGTQGSTTAEVTSTP